VKTDPEQIQQILLNLAMNAQDATPDGGTLTIETANASHPGPIDLLVTDVIMPGISGRTLPERVVKGHPKTRILFCSGYAETAVVHHGVLAPDVEFLQKPFTPHVLLRRIRSVLGGS
jgi:two-component system cell cycle sensor histidine kinase/response regulator CckA